MLTIASLHAREILDSRGNPTLEVDCVLEGGARGRAAVAAGASRGGHAGGAWRAGAARPVRGKRVQKAVRTVAGVLAPALLGTDAFDQAGLDARLIELDGRPNKGRLGGHGLHGVAMGAGS